MNPVVLLAGVGLWSALYEEMKRNLASDGRFSEKIFIVPLTPLDWVGFPPSPERSTNRVMRRLHETIARVETLFPNEPITLVAHSGGGTVALIYLLGENFQGDAYSNASVQRLVALGTPFRSVEKFAKIKTDFIAERLTPRFFDKVEVISVASSFRKGDPNGDLRERLAFELYRNTFGDGKSDGDGVVPIEACHLDGATNVVIKGAEHLPAPFANWYGATRAVAQWKAYLLQTEPRA
ncbi:MAG: alpha/beta hydrolase [Chloroherpetonaceae bacterium]|nr:alpha/beta hydrolase [Chloroherpetonaceae bacterium]MDW8437717.1 alpha/beta fold hydrolase [Chloroherpetonaceae bacterium]